MTGAKKSKVPKITLFMLVDNAKEFLEFGHSSNSFLPELLPQSMDFQTAAFTSKLFDLISSY